MLEFRVMLEEEECNRMGLSLYRHRYNVANINTDQVLVWCQFPWRRQQGRSGCRAMEASKQLAPIC